MSLTPETLSALCAEAKKEEARARIFDAFFSTHAGGMGMGLAICRSITEAHHGRILVGQDTQLGGALFTVQLPLASTP